ncbi:MAG: hypothetical protein AAF962_03990 [Actinomycetota bacterium]
MMALFVSALVAVGFGYLAVDDARTQQVVVSHARAVTAVALVGLGAVGLASTDWPALLTATLGAGLVVAIQLVPYLIQRRRGEDMIGRADVRLALPFGWTLGYHGFGFVLVGFATALLGGLAYSILLRRRRIPFVPFLTMGLVIGLAWSTTTP